MELYRNAVLSVIAIALTAIAIQMAIAPSYAVSSINLQKVQICDETGRCAKIDPTFDALTIKDPL